MKNSTMVQLIKNVFSVEGSDIQVDYHDNVSYLGGELATYIVYIGNFDDVNMVKKVVEIQIKDISEDYNHKMFTLQTPIKVHQVTSDQYAHALAETHVGVAQNMVLMDITETGFNKFRLLYQHQESLEVECELVELVVNEISSTLVGL